MISTDIFNNSFVNLIFIGLIALFPVVNPIGTAFLISPYLKNLPVDQKKVAVKKITFYAFGFCTCILFAGPFILQAFGITICIIQLGGGIMICKTGWDFLNSDARQANEDTLKTNITETNIIDKLFYPITFPITTGAGTISVLLTLGAHTQAVSEPGFYVHFAAILISVAVMCALIYVSYLNVRRLLHFFGPHGEDVVKRICAFLVF